MDTDELLMRIRTGDSREAISEFLDSHPEMDLESLAVSAIQSGLDDISVAVLRALLDEKPIHLAAHDHLAGLLHRQKKFVESGPHYQFVVDNCPERANGYSGLCWAHFIAGKVEKLRETLLKAKQNIQDGYHINWQAGTNCGNLSQKSHTLLRLAVNEAVAAVRSSRRRPSEGQEVAAWLPHRSSNQNSNNVELKGISRGGRAKKGLFTVGNDTQLPATPAAAG
ncbi:MAG: hypothetical protein COW30_02585, partial [Rhodospirillales bacterium CG15_BIG_FIL_POST_REV_8_21_14_020_66_15]